MPKFKVETVEPTRVILVDEEKTYITFAFNKENKDAIRALEDGEFKTAGEEVELDLSDLFKSEVPQHSEDELEAGEAANQDNPPSEGGNQP